MSDVTPGSSDEASATRLRLDLAYEGTAFTGWSKQPGRRTVQGVLEPALATLFRHAAHEPRLTVAGRTDAGVHALAQVAHVDVPSDVLERVSRPRSKRHPANAERDEVVRRRLAGILGRTDNDVVITRVRPAAAGFDARFSAVWRRYEYRVADAAAVRDPLQRRRTVWRTRSLDVEAMDAAARSLVGLRDFASFCKPRVGATTIRTLQSFSWARSDDGVLRASLQADAFCHSMVRALVGACVAVGEGRLAASDPLELLLAGERTSAFMVMPAAGLTLTEVGYPPDDELELRASQTRARRELRVEGIVG